MFLHGTTILVWYTNVLLDYNLWVSANHRICGCVFRFHWPKSLVLNLEFFIFLHCSPHKVYTHTNTHARAHIYIYIYIYIYIRDSLICLVPHSRTRQIWIEHYTSWKPEFSTWFIDQVSQSTDARNNNRGIERIGSHFFRSDYKHSDCRIDFCRRCGWNLINSTTDGYNTDNHLSNIVRIFII